MSHRSIHYFDANGKEVEEGSAESVVQYDEATAERLGLKFKAAKDEPVQDARERIAESMRLANLDGSTKKEQAATAPLSAADVEDEPQRKSAKK